tara:strand:- start:21716 stop:23017 length:1302 start_codon:yes stop_codon:yes gene_type:complete
MKNILIFTRDMMPYVSSPGAAVRVLYMTKFLKKKGFNVNLVAAKGNPISYFGLKEEVDFIKPIYIDDFIQRWQSRNSQKDLTSIRKKKLFDIKQKIKLFLKKIVLFFSVPDIGIFSVPKFTIKLYFLINRMKIDTLIISSPPHSNQIVTLILKIIFKNKIFIIVDYRDGWNTFKIFQESGLIKKILSQGLEKRLLKLVDFFVYQSPKVQSDIISLYKFDQETFCNKSQLVRNGYTKVPPCKKALINLKEDSCGVDEFLLGYFGGLDFSSENYRNPIKIFNELEELNLKINIAIFGTVWKKDHCPSFKNINIKFYGATTLSEAKKYMHDCDGLLCFHADNSGSEVIPGKFYEYIDSLRPIISFGPRDMECGNIISKYEFGIHIPFNEISSFRSVISSFFLKKDFNNFIERLNFHRSKFSRQNQYSRLLKRLEEL